MVQVLNRDQNDMRFILADVSTGDFSEVYSETRPTWIDFFEDIYVMNDGTGFIVRSYRNDWYNLYYYGWDGRLISRITDFDWKVTGIAKVDETRREIYFTGTGTDPLGSHLYRVRLDGTKLIQITSGDGTHMVSVSPGGYWFLDTWSSLVNPGGMDLIDRKGKLVRSIHQEEAVPFDPERHQKYELTKIRTSDGLFDMPALITCRWGLTRRKSTRLYSQFTEAPTREASATAGRARRPGGMQRTESSQSMLIIAVPVPSERKDSIMFTGALANGRYPTMPMP
jgi:dipeptidyl-peptidase-4